MISTASYIPNSPLRAQIYYPRQYWGPAPPPHYEVQSRGGRAVDMSGERSTLEGGLVVVGCYGFCCHVIRWREEVEVILG